MTGSEPLDLRRRWLAITLGTVVMQFAYWPIAGAIGTRASGDTVVAGDLLVLGLAVVPFSFMVLAFASRHSNFAMATLKGLGLFILIGIPLIVLDALTGAAAGLAAGGAVALQRDDVHSLKWRWIAVAVIAVYLLVLRIFALEFALMSGAVLPFTVLGLVDQAAETR